MELLKGGVCAPKGFKAGSFAAKIKYEGRDDMALIISETGCTYAGVFTRNIVKAAPVKWDKKILDSKNEVRMVVANSGIANAATGAHGDDICKETADYAGKVFNVDSDQVLIASTGVIGFDMPMDRVKNGIDALKENIGDTNDFATNAAKAIMTTDTHDKQVACSVIIDGKTVTIGGMAKGSGMIHPNMCTMLSFITTDVNINRYLLQKMLVEITEDTFNMVSVDGDTSTNDTCVVLANKLAGNKELNENDADCEVFREALFYVCKEISMMLAGDGEGATALVEAEAINVKSKEDARMLAKSVITSSLTKAAIYGHDANWGRIMCALGYSGVEFDPDKLDIYVSSKDAKIKLVENGRATDYSEKEATKVLSAKKVIITCDIKEGDYEATAWGCDLTYDYIKINADYRS